ncbi:MAG: flotillin family protein [Bacteroidaceae bacterium]|nr:flotillin family protein [Bacteroidaceae bacterium]MBR5148213.1 flotillin family protein [Bacteroidaceae bacterium]
MNIAFLGLILVVVGFATIAAVIRRYRRCPSDKILVVYGKTGGGSAKCIHGGGKFVWPIIQDYAYLNLTPISIDANLTNALSRQNIRVDVPCRFTVGISTEPDSMNNAAERLLGLTSSEIQELARDILFGQLRLVIATMSIEEINSDRDKFLENISKNVEVELKKIGLRLINVNVTDIKDESGYIEALGKEAAAKAINEAKVSVAEQDKYGEIGKAEAVRDTRIKTSEANAIAVKGENNAQIEIANSNAFRREKEAEANRLATAAEKVQQAKALQEAYAAEKDAELARAERERSTQQANIIVPEEVEKQRRIIEAEAEAEKARVKAKGEADAIYAKMEAEAKGLYEILTKQAAGYDKMVQAAGGDANKAYMLLLLEKLPELVKTQVEAVKGVNIDHVTVWDSGNGADGKGSTANFVSGLMKSVPPLSDLFDLAGMSLPEYLGKKTQVQDVTAIEDEK